jgi:hypothetical protein
MTDQESSPAAQPRPAEDSKQLPSSQGSESVRRRRAPAWIRQLPKMNFQPAEPDPKYELIDREEVRQVLGDVRPEIRARIEADIEFLDYELLRLFRHRDHRAKKQQNRYRLNQIVYLVLATVATALGSAQAIALSSAPETMPIYSFAETVVALIATYLATTSGRESPFTDWLSSRRRAEQLRREYFRYLTHLPPYDQFKHDDYERKLLLSKRAADINRGVYPEEPVL